MLKAKKIIIVLVIIVALLMGLLLIHNSYTDRVNPFISKTISYAKVNKGTQTYHNVTLIDPKNGKKSNYKLKTVGGYDPDGQYILIKHKGQYVQEIRYISEKMFNKTVKK